MAFIEINVDMQKFLTAIKRFPTVLPKNMGAAGQEALEMILDTEGLRNYPPETAANRPPTPYYERGAGTHYKSGIVRTSQNYGKHWETEAEGYVAKAKNTGVDYNEFLGGENQVWWASGYGWKKLVSTAKEMIGEIVKIYQTWLDTTIEELGL